MNLILRLYLTSMKSVKNDIFTGTVNRGINRDINKSASEMITNKIQDPT